MTQFYQGISTTRFSFNSIRGMATNAAGSSSTIRRLSASLSNVTHVMRSARSLVQHPPLTDFASMATGGLGRILSSRGVTPSVSGGAREPRSLSGVGSLLHGLGGEDLGLAHVTSFVGGRLGMLTSVKTSGQNLCPSFEQALSNTPWSTCMPQNDCLGIDCDITIKNMFVSGKMSVNLRVLPEDRTVQITTNGKQINITSPGEGTLSAGITVLSMFEIQFKVDTHWQNSGLQFSLSVLACTASGAKCLPTIPVMRNIQFDFSWQQTTSESDLLSPSLSHMETLPVDQLPKILSDFNLPTTDVVGQIQGIQESISSSVQIKPFVAGEFHAAVELSIVIAAAGIEKSIGVELIPIELKLRGYVKIGVWIFAVKFSVTIWHWRASPIKGTIWQKEYRQDDMGPPRFPYCDRVSDQCVETTTTETPTGNPYCFVKQLKGRHPKDAAFQIE
ncbi:hypothetical protein BaRGS_00028719, partial [Batillaria attramentaria]